ncbi:MAG: PD-(D/E)XK nuclease family protein [Flavobacterium sp.]
MSVKSELYPVLSVANAHPRDQLITFFEEGHKYIIHLEPNVVYTSVTTWIHRHFDEFDADKIIHKMMTGKGWKEGHKYWGQTPDQIKALWNANRDAASGAGTDLHYEIECFHNDKRFQFAYTNKELYEMYMAYHAAKLPHMSLEWQYFIEFIKDHPHLTPYRTEWVVFHEDIKISGSIDMVYQNPDGTLSIYDWKRSKQITRVNTFNRFATTPCISHLHDTNFWHYALQLNMYKYILESKYGKTIKDLYLVRLHPDADGVGSYELIQLPILTNEVRQLMDERIKQVSSENT